MKTITQVLLNSGCPEEAVEGAVIIDGVDEAVTGYAYNKDDKIYLIYDYEIILDIFMSRDGMTREEAVEWIDFNFYFPEMQGPVVMHRLNKGE